MLTNVPQDGDTALLIATPVASSETVQQLLEMKADPDVQDKATTQSALYMYHTQSALYAHSLARFLTDLRSYCW